MPMRAARLVVTVLDGPWKDRRVLVANPVPEVMTLPVRARGGGTEQVSYVVQKGPHGYIAQRLGHIDQTLPSIGWRGWHLVDKDGEMRITSAGGDVWPIDGPLVARCTVGKAEDDQTPVHDAPAAGCTCGIYAARSLSWLIQQGYALSVFGMVTLWGRYRAHDQGYRFERAYPLALILNDALTPDSSSNDGGIFGPEIGSDRVDHGTAALMGKLARMRDTYRVPVALGAAERGLDIAARMIGRSLLPTWTANALPPDVRIHMANNNGGR